MELAITTGLRLIALTFIHRMMLGLPPDARRRYQRRSSIGAMVVSICLETAFWKRCPVMSAVSRTSLLTTLM
jgi:hypothetical protein